VIPFVSVFEVFTNASSDKRVVSCFLSRLESLKDWFERQRLFLFIAASLFLSYDADLVASRPGPAEWDPSKVVLKMIDFAHVFPADGVKDDNFIFGLSNLIAIFRRVQGWGTFHRPDLGHV
jgi:1D-myo-inositol-tetrakisphosphate 5-kinase/inositol-polyphosphate multikinase